jgi:pyruvate dehydrogenase E1 component alpha subunit
MSKATIKAKTATAAKSAKQITSGNGAAPKSAKSKAAPDFAGLDREQLLHLLYQMVLIRRFEERAARSYSEEGKIGGFCHLYIGQEAVAVGALAALRADDSIITSYREHGHAIARGISPDEVMAELYGKAGGCSGGKGGSMHMFDASLNFMGGHGIVGGQIPIGTGAAFASKYLGKDSVTLCFMGEAAVNQGAFHESLNMAQLWGLPVIYICENNKYGMGTSIDRGMSQTRVANKAAGYDMHGETVDGMDVIAVYEAVARVVKRAREEMQPALLDVLTYRYMGHSMSDPGNYRTRAEIAQQQEKDCVKRLAAKLKEAGLLADEELTNIEARVKEEVAKAVKFAEESPFPDTAELMTHVYAQPL